MGIVCLRTPDRMTGGLAGTAEALARIAVVTARVAGDQLY